MATAQRIFVLYGTVSLAVGMLLGLPLSRIRSTRPDAPHHLVVAHTSALMQGSMHLALAVAVGLATASAWVETTAAGLLAGGSALFVAGATCNWLQGIGDHFAARSLGWKLLAASGPLHLVGIAIVAVAVVPAALG